MFGYTKCFLLLMLTGYGYTSNPILKIKQGILQGIYVKTAKGRTISSFNAIPYAKPPIGNLRFEVAQPADRWNGILDASKPGSICPQRNIFENDSMTGDENCLYLNVYTPQIKFLTQILPRNLPVMIFFHGGGFLLGGDDENPDLLLDKDIVLVVPHYRLGPLGFLSSGDAILPGNNGLKDQNVAIKWVKENIHYFGGNPKKITLFGQSAGGASAHFHMISPLSQGLINGVISESGNALSVWALAPNDQGIRHSKQLAEALNCSTTSSIKMVECLRQVDAYEITKKQEMFDQWNKDPMIPFKPVIEPNIKGAFLPDHPINIIKSGKVAKVPFIAGITSEDGAMKSPEIFGNPQLIDEFSKDFRRLAPISLLYDETSPDKDYVTDRIYEFYFDNKTIDDSSRDAATDMYTDCMFLSSNNDVVQLHVKYTREPVYAYVFGYRGSVSYSTLFGDPYHDYGVAHADELLYLFTPKPDRFPNYVQNATERDLTEILTTLWTNFATTGNPTPRKNSIIHTIWEPNKNGKLDYYFIKNATNIKMVANVYHERAEFWKSLPIN